MIHVANLNDKISVELTDYGIEILKSCPEGLVDYEYCFNKESKILQTQLWRLALIFGDKLWNGNKQIIMNNRIEFI